MSKRIDEPPSSGGSGDGCGETGSRRESLVQLRDATIRSEIQIHRDDWLASLAADRYGCLDLHPDLLAPAEMNPPSGLIVIARWRTATAGAAGRDWLAVLRPRKLRFHLLPGPSPTVAVSGHRLEGNQIIGGGSPAEIAPFVKEMSELLASRQTESVIMEDVEMDGAASGGDELCRVGWAHRRSFDRPTAGALVDRFSAESGGLLEEIFGQDAALFSFHRQKARAHAGAVHNEE